MMNTINNQLTSSKKIGNSLLPLFILIATLFMFALQKVKGQSIHLTGSNTSIINKGYLYVNGGLVNSNTSIINNEGIIRVNEKWENNAATNMLNKDTGKVEMIGTGLQNISGTTSFYELEINNALGANILSGKNEIHHTLYLTDGTLTTNDSLVLISDSNRTARIDEIQANANIKGDIIMERYIDAGATNWRFLATATDDATIADWNEDFITSGFIGSDFPNWPTPANPWVSIYFYDETNPGSIDDGFVPVTNVTNSINVGQGVWVWSGDTITGTQAFTVDVQGPSNKFNVNLPLTYTSTGIAANDGWNMVGNPYPSTIDWDDPSIMKTGINNAIYIWNPDLAQYASYIAGIGLNGGSNYIASSQGFWVQAITNNPSVQLSESCKTPEDATFLKQAAPTPLIINVQNNIGTDQLAINAFDPLYDAQKIFSVDSLRPSILSIMHDSINLSINQLPTQEISIPIKVLTGVTGFLQFDIENVSSFGNPSCLILEDVFTGTTYDLTSATTFNIFISDTTTIPQFLLHIGTQMDSTITIHGDTLTANAHNTNYQWLDCDNGFTPISGATSQSFQPTTNGNYAVQLTSTFCNRIDTSECVSFFSVNVNELLKDDSRLIIYPNPFTEATTFSFAEKTKEEMQLILMNELGQVVLENKIKKGTDQFILNRNQLTKGIYFYNITSRTAIFSSGKLVVQ